MERSSYISSSQRDLIFDLVKKGSIRDLFTLLTNKDFPMEIQIEKMEDNTIGFKCEFFYYDFTIQFFSMNVRLSGGGGGEGEGAEGEEQLQPILFVLSRGTHNHLEKVKFLSPSSRKITQIDPITLNSIVHYCCFWGQDKALKIAYKLGIPIHSKNKYNKNPLEISFLKNDMGEGKCFHFLKNHQPLIISSESLKSDLDITITRVNFSSPF